MLRLFWLLWLPITAVHAFENWPELSQNQDDALRTQRDVADDIPLDQLSYFGASLNQLIFDPLGYNSAALSLVLSLLEVKVGALLLDLYWNEFTQTWQLCPAPFPNNLTTYLTDTVEVSWNGQTYRCEPGLSPTDLMATIALYLRSSNTNLDVNIVLVLLNLKSIFYEPLVAQTNLTSNATSTLTSSVPSGYESYNDAYLLVGNSSLAQSVSRLGSFLFTPQELETFAASGASGNYSDYYSSQYPTLYNFLFNLFKRTMVYVLSNDLNQSQTGYNITEADTAAIFFPNYENFDPTFVSSTETSILDLCSSRKSSGYNTSVYTNEVARSHFRTVFDDRKFPFTNSSLHQWAECGYSPILNATYSEYAQFLTIKANDTLREVGAVINNYIPNQYWSWAENQPDSLLENSTTSQSPQNISKRESTDVFQSLSDSQFAYKCVAITTEGWTVKNCYDKYRVACQNKTNPFDWTILSSLAPYFDLINDNRCPTNFTFSLPQLSVEQMALITFLNSKNILTPVWIDLNDITISGCFVSGGPYAECPYKKIVTTLNLIRRIAPSIVMAFVIVLLIFYERFLMVVPVHTNRKRHWKRVINQYNKENEYEGVPS